MYINKIDTMFQISSINDCIKIWFLFLNLQIYKKSSVVKQTIEYVVSFYEKKDRSQTCYCLMTYCAEEGTRTPTPYGIRS